ncbi:hypothetical protein ALC62_12452 [Cyphomyrmex costatus]|uniref:Uncharacterized protein n=1 Tax=Cyphomyrmex costatus TaxID=456900 RepID=A0A151IB36_9HYME|nr:hypothetical protein ALC62_12452 [Cyphomyrmex costatus]
MKRDRTIEDREKREGGPDCGAAQRCKGIGEFAEPPRRALQGRGAKAAQKLNLSSSPHRRRRSGDENIGSDELPIFPNGYAALLLKSPPPAPPALLRRIGVKELTGVGKKTSCLQLRVVAYSSLSSPTFERVLPECQRDFGGTPKYGPRRRFDSHNYPDFCFDLSCSN